MSTRLAARVLAVSLAVGAGVPIALSWARPKTAVGSLAAVESVKPSRPLASGSAAGTEGRVSGPTIRIHSARLADEARATRAPRPTRILIPSLGVSAAVVPVGVSPDGHGLQIPSDVDVVGWYRFGPAPGQAGSTLVVGHVDARDQGPGAFFGLRGLGPGALIAVRRDDGQTVEYRVIARRSYIKGSLPSLVFARRGPPVLALVTCGGTFDETTRHYSDNVVVFAVPGKP